MLTANGFDGQETGGTSKTLVVAPAPDVTRVPNLTSARVWREISKASFAVLSYVTPGGKPRSSGVIYATIGGRMYVAVAEDSWKARHIAVSQQVAVTVPVRRGGIMSLLLPIPPATISFHASAIVRPGSSLQDGELSKALAPLLPAERRSSCRIIEIGPVDEFLTYGLGVSLMQMRNPDLARAHVPVG